MYSIWWLANVIGRCIHCNTIYCIAYSVMQWYMSTSDAKITSILHKTEKQAVSSHPSVKSDRFKGTWAEGCDQHTSDCQARLTEALIMDNYRLKKSKDCSFCQRRSGTERARHTETLTSEKKRRFHWRPEEQRADSPQISSPRETRRERDAADRIEADRREESMRHIKRRWHFEPIRARDAANSHSTAGMKVHKGAVTHLMLLKRGII